MKAWADFKKWFRLMTGIIRSISNDPNAWEASIREFEVQDKSLPPRDDIILFVGSSTFTFWETLEKDMAPLNIINRGFGGSKLADVVYYFERIVLPHKPKAIVLFAGTNDIAGPKPASPQQVFKDYLSFVAKLKTYLPDTRLFYLAITPSPSRWEYWPIASEANRLIQEYSRKHPELHFMSANDRFIGRGWKPDPKLYRRDRLHPNKKGYELLTKTIKSVLLKRSGL